MSNGSRRQSLGKRGGRGQKQPGTSGNFTRVERKEVEMQENPMLIQLDSDDPYKFIDSQSLLPDDNSDVEAMTVTPVYTPTTTASRSSARDRRNASNIEQNTATPGRSPAVGGSRVGAGKRKQTPRRITTKSTVPDMDTVEEDGWQQKDMEMAIKASLQEKQREERRNRQKMREAKVEMEEQVRLIAEFQGEAVLPDKERSSNFEEGMEEVLPSSEPGRPIERDVSKPTLNSNVMPPSSVVSTPTSATCTPLALRSVSVKKLSMKSLQLNKDRKSESTTDELAPVQQTSESQTGSDEAKIIDEGPSEKTITKHASTPSSADLFSNESTKHFETKRTEEVVPIDSDSDDTPPISEHRRDIEESDKGQTATDTPLSIAACNTINKRDTLRDDSETAMGKRHTPVTNSKTRSSKVVLSLKKNRKRLSDTDDSSFQEIPATSVEGPLPKRPKIQDTDTNPRTGDSSSTTSGARQENQRQVRVSTEKFVLSKEKNLKMATISLVDVKKTQETAKRDDISENQGTKSVVNLVSGDTKSIENECKSKNTTSAKLENNLKKVEERPVTKTVEERPVTKTMEGHHKNQDMFEKEQVTMLGRASTRKSGYIVKRKASGWPLVKIRASDIPRNPSLQAPPGVSAVEHSRVLIRCFDDYSAHLAMAQCKVLWRVKWGPPVSAINKVAANSLSAGRRTRRSRAVNIPYSEYALDMKDMHPSLKRQLSPPTAVSKVSVPSKSPPGSSSACRGILSPSDSDSDFAPQTSSEKQKIRQTHQLTSSARHRRLDFSDGETVNAPESGLSRSKSPQGKVLRLSLGRKKSPQKPGEMKVDKSPKSSRVQVEREESPDLVPSRQQPNLRSEVASESITSSTRRATPPVHGTVSSVSPTFPNDDVMMLDLTSPSPPPPPSPKTGRRVEGAGSDNEIECDFNNVCSGEGRLDVLSPLFGVNIDAVGSGDEQDHPHSHATGNSHRSHGNLGMADSGNNQQLLCFGNKQERHHSGNKQKHPHSGNELEHSHSGNEWEHTRSNVPTDTVVSHSRVYQDTDSSDDEQIHSPSRSSSSGNWLSARKPPAQQPRSSKRSTKRTNGNARSNAKSKKKADGGVGGGKSVVPAKGKRSTKKSTSASMRIKALIQKSGSNSEHSSQEEHQPATTPGSRLAGESTDSDFTDVEVEEQRRNRSATSACAKTDSSTAGRKVSDKATRSAQDRPTHEGVIDLTTDTQIPSDHASHSVPSSPRSDSPRDDGCVPCPICARRFDQSVIEVHAEQCEGPESDLDLRQSEDITAYYAKTTPSSSSSRTKSAAGVKRGSGLSTKKRGQRGRRSYQPSLKQLVGKELEINREEDIDSSTTSDERGDPFDDFTYADKADFGARGGCYDDADLEWTEREGSASRSVGSSGGHPLPEDGEGGFMRESSADSDAHQLEAIPVEDGRGGYIIDPSMVSSSPIRTFKRLSDLDPQERAGFDNQFKSKDSRGRKSQRARGRRAMTNEEKRSSTWGRDDFGDLFDSGERSRGRGRGRPRGRGGFRGRRPFKYDSNKARGRGRRGGSRGRAL